MPDRLDRAILGRALRRGSRAVRRTRHGRRADGARARGIAAPAPARSAVRSLGAGPGYIKGYPPGIRENGGQYTHAAVWFVMALARLGQRRRSRRAVPHAQSDQPYTDRRRRWSATRRNRASWPAMSTPGRRTPAGAAGAGIPDRRRGCTVRVSKHSGAAPPRLPSSASIRAFLRRGPDTKSAWRVHNTRYVISVSNPDRQCRGVVNASLDDTIVDPAAIPIADDGRTHRVHVVLGSARARRVG